MRDGRQRRYNTLRVRYRTLLQRHVEVDAADSEYSCHKINTSLYRIRTRLLLTSTLSYGSFDNDMLLDDPLTRVRKKLYNFLDAILTTKSPTINSRVS